MKMYICSWLRKVFNDDGMSIVQHTTLNKIDITCFNVLFTYFMDSDSDYDIISKPLYLYLKIPLVLRRK
jgi:hypothetical protein